MYSFIVFIALNASALALVLRTGALVLALALRVGALVPSLQKVLKVLALRALRWMETPQEDRLQ